jgi:hypothetical protein
VVRTLSYYAAVGRQLSPAQLARLAARRVYRATQKAWRRPVVPEPGRILRGFRVDAVDALPEAALRIRHSWADVSRREATAMAVRAVPGAAEEALARARRAADREFDLFGTRVRFDASGPIDWHRDPLSGYRFPPQPVERARFLREGTDPKYPWALGRLDQLVALGQGYWISEDQAERRRFAQQFSAQLLDFLSSNPAGLGIQWCNPMEVALRAANIAQSLLMFRDADPAREPAFVFSSLRSLEEHGSFVEAHLENTGVVPNNHLIANYVGLLVVALLFPELPGSSRRRAVAASGLCQEMRAQVLEDGFSFEGSIPYHRLAVELFTHAHVTAIECGIDLGASFEQRLRKMYRVAAEYCSENGIAPQIGDNDSGRALPLRDRQSLDHGYLADLGAALFDDASLKRGSALPDEAAWLLGEKGLKRFSALPIQSPARLLCLKSGGLSVLRGAGAVVAISAGPQGQRGVGGHSHNDKLSFELHVGGRPVVVDIGTGTYTRDPRRRDAFRSTAAHNTLEVNGQEQAPIPAGRLFALPEAARAEVVEAEQGEGRLRLTARHQGYRRLCPPLVHDRVFVLDERHQGLSIQDRLSGEGLHQAICRLHLPDREVRLRPIAEAERIRAIQVRGGAVAFGTTVAELGPPGAPLATALFEEGLEVNLEDSLYSPGYGRVGPAKAVSYGMECEMPAAWTAVLLF